MNKVLLFVAFMLAGFPAFGAPVLTGSVSNQASIDIDWSSVASGALKVRVYIYDVRVEIDGACVDMMTSSDGGASFDNSAGQYEWAFEEIYNDATVIYKASTADHSSLDFQVRLSTSIGNDTGENGAFDITFHNPNGTAFHKLIEHTAAHHFTNGKILAYQGAATRKSSAAINAVRIRAANNNHSGAVKGNISASWAVYAE